MQSSLKDSARKVQEYLIQRGYAFTVRELPSSARTAEQAASSIGCSVSQIAKSLVFKDQDSGDAVLVIASGSNRVDLAKIKSANNLVLDMASAAYVREKTGYAIGGIPPVAHTEKLTTLLDRDLRQYPSIWAAAGTPDTVFELKAEDLEALTAGSWMDIAEDQDG